MGIGVAAEVDAGFELSLGKKDWDKLGGILKKDREQRIWNPYRISQTGVCDANGNLNMKIGDPLPVGSVFKITNIIQMCQTFTPATVYSNAAAWFAYYYDSGSSVANLVDLGPSTAGGTVFPNKKDYANDADPILTGGHQIWFQLTGTAGLSGLTVTVILAGLMQNNPDLVGGGFVC